MLPVEGEKQMTTKTRREFIRLAGTGAAAAALGPFLHSSFRGQESRAAQKPVRLKLGMASYSFREFGLNPTLDMTKRLALEHICFKSFHLPLESTVEEIESTAARVKEAGLDLYGCGVVYMTSEAEVNRAFQYARTAGMRVIVGVPNHELLDLVDKKVKEFDIQVAIHNHGPGDKLYPTPESAYEKIKNLDKRIGLCIDVGHTERSGVNPSESVLRFFDRLLDVHLKDVSASSAEGTTVEAGRGVIDIPAILRALLEIEFQGIASFEFEKDGKDPLPGVAESVGYVRGVLSQL
jgi:inosose dehydratase